MTIKNYFRLMAEGRYGGPMALLWKPFLKLGGFFYALVTGVRKTLYNMHLLPKKKLKIPVVSIGNISWGGVGKTPLTLYLSRYFLQEKKTPLVLTRGYGSDETKEYASDLPGAILGVGKNRYRTAQKFLSSQKGDVAILDDGFQHWQLHRDLNIVVINALNPFGNYSLIPCGILRELPVELKRADVIVFNDVNLLPRKNFEKIQEEVRNYAPQAEFVEAQRDPLYFYWARSKNRLELSKLRGKRVTTFSGVGTPRSFQLLMNHLGVKTVRNFEFEDHHPFTDRDLNDVLELKQSSGSEFVITTEKDFLRKEEKISKMVDPLILKTSLRITVGEAALKEKINRLWTS